MCTLGYDGRLPKVGNHCIHFLLTITQRSRGGLRGQMACLCLTDQLRDIHLSFLPLSVTVIPRSPLIQDKKMKQNKRKQ